jgi:hypothetical protein
MPKRFLLISSLIAGFVVAILLPGGTRVGDTVATAHASVAVPEPSTLALVTVGLGALAWWSSRTR